MDTTVTGTHDFGRPWEFDPREKRPQDLIGQAVGRFATEFLAGFMRLCNMLTLDPHEFRLLFFYMAEEGQYGTEKLARFTHMSAGAVSEAKKGLVDKGYIQVRRKGKGPGKPDIVEVAPSLWFGVSSTLQNMKGSIPEIEKTLQNVKDTLQNVKGSHVSGPLAHAFLLNGILNSNSRDTTQDPEPLYSTLNGPLSIESNGTHISGDSWDLEALFAGPAEEDEPQGPPFKLRPPSLPTSSGPTKPRPVVKRRHPQWAFDKMFSICYLMRTPTLRKGLTQAMIGKAGQALDRLVAAGHDLSGLDEFESKWMLNWRARGSEGSYQPPRPAQVVELWLEITSDNRIEDLRAKNPTQAQKIEDEAYDRLQDAMLRRAKTHV